MNKEIPFKNCLYAFVSQTGWPFWEQVLFSEFNLIRIPSDRPPLDAELIHATSTAYELEEKGIFGSIGMFGQCVWPVFYQVVVGREWCRSVSNSSFNHPITGPQFIIQLHSWARSTAWGLSMSGEDFEIKNPFGQVTRPFSSVASETAGI